jgi:hypothetical protein
MGGTMLHREDGKKKPFDGFRRIILLELKWRHSANVGELCPAFQTQQSANLCFSLTGQYLQVGFFMP